MRRLFLCLVIIGFTLSGCSRQKGLEPETGFFRDFTVAEIVSRMKESELKPGSSDFGSTSSPGIRRRRDFNFVYAIEEREGAKFDEVSFIMKLKAEAERAAYDAGVRINDSGVRGNAFHFGYSNEEHEGWLEVTGTRMEGNQYRLWGVLRESTKNAKQ
jgi:hypothetical protein